MLCMQTIAHTWNAIRNKKCLQLLCLQWISAHPIIWTPASYVNNGHGICIKLLRIRSVDGGRSVLSLQAISRASIQCKWDTLPINEWCRWFRTSSIYLLTNTMLQWDYWRGLTIFFPFHWPFLCAEHTAAAVLCCLSTLTHQSCDHLYSVSTS